MANPLLRLLAVAAVVVVVWCKNEFVPPSTPDYDELEKWEASRLSENEDFQAACKEMAGYYKDPNRRPDMKNVLLMAGVNNGYKDFFHNFKCYADRLGIKFLPVSFDEGIYKYLTENNVMRTVLMGDIPGRGRVAAEPSGFGGKNFNLIGCRKMEAVGAALKLGYDVIFSDVDIALLRDPLDFLFFPGIDYVHSTNKGCNGKWRFNETMEGNTGFYAVKSNPASIRTWDLTYRACSRAPLYDDQTMFWLVLRTNSNPVARPLTACPPHSPVSALLGSGDSGMDPFISNTIASCPLDDCIFSASHLKDANQLHILLRELQLRRNRPKSDPLAKLLETKPVMVHANWMNGKELKKGAMMRNGLWIARRGDHLQQQQHQHHQQQQHGRHYGNWTCVGPSGPLS